MKRLFKVILWIAVIAAVIHIGKKIIYGRDGGGGGELITPPPSQQIGLNTPAPGIVQTPVPVTAVPYSTPNPGGQADSTPVPGTIVDPIDVPQGMSGLFYYQLDDLERNIYDNCLYAANSGNKYCTVPDMTYSQYEYSLRRAYYAFVQDHPEFVWLTNGYVIHYNDNPSESKMTNCTLEFQIYEFWDLAYNPQQYIDLTMDRVRTIASAAAQQPTDYDKALFVYDYLITNAYYDYERLEDAEKTVHNATSDLIFTAYGCLVEGRCVCAGYAKAYKLIMNELGINCLYASGFAGGGRHAWNMVEINGDYYQVDATWGDGGFTKSDGTEYENVINYEYFLTTTEELGVDHTLNEEFLTYPPADATRYNYFVYSGYLLDSFDMDAVRSIISRQYNKQPIMLKFSNYSAFSDAKDNIYSSNMSELLGRTVDVWFDNAKYIFYLLTR